MTITKQQRQIRADVGLTPRQQAFLEELAWLGGTVRQMTPGEQRLAAVLVVRGLVEWRAGAKPELQLTNAGRVLASTAQERTPTL